MSDTCPVLKNFDGSFMSFEDVLELHGWSVSDFAECVGVSRQCIYKYIKGQVHPDRIPYTVVTDWCQYFGITDMQLYNAMVESYESERIWCETLGKWMLPEEIIEKVR